MGAQHADKPLDLPKEVEEAIDLFRRAPVGQQLADPSETNGRCGRATGRFISALRELGSDAIILEWGGLENAWHQAVLLPDRNTVVDWTASQFEVGEAALRNCPYPRIESLATAIDRWGDPARIDPDDKLARRQHDIPEPMPWSEARKLIPKAGSVEEKEIRG